MEPAIESLWQDVNRCINAYERNVHTESTLNNQVFDLFVDALRDNPRDTERIVFVFERLSDSIKLYFEYMLRRLPCEGNYWDWPPGLVLANPGGVVAWQTPPPEIQDAIAALRRCVIACWSAQEQSRDVAPGGPVRHIRPRRTRKDLRLALVLWAKGIVKPDDVLGSVIDCFDEGQMAQDWTECEECDRERIHKLLASDRPSEIPLGFPGPPDRELERDRARKYLTLLRLLALEPSPEWQQEHRTCT